MTRCVLCIVEVTGTFRVWEEGGRGGAGGCSGSCSHAQQHQLQRRGENS